MVTVGRHGGSCADSTELLLELNCAIFLLDVMRCLLDNLRANSTRIHQVLTSMLLIIRYKLSFWCNLTSRDYLAPLNLKYRGICDGTSCVVIRLIRLVAGERYNL